MLEIESARTGIKAHRLEGGDLALAARHVVDDKTSSGLSGVLVVEKIPHSSQYEEIRTFDRKKYLLGI